MLITHLFLITSRLAMWNIAQQKTTHEAEIFGTELVAVVQVENVLLAYTAFYRRRHFYHRAGLCDTSSYQSHAAVVIAADRYAGITNQPLKRSNIQQSMIAVYWVLPSCSIHS